MAFYVTSQFMKGCKYVLININKSSVIRRLKTTINRYGEANEENGMLFSTDAENIKYLIEIYTKHGM